jgi:hypothetical protein
LLRRASTSSQAFGFDGVQTLLASLDDEYPNAICELVFPITDNYYPSEDFAPSNWQWFRPILLAAASADPQKMIP